jgi:hypothetical protein
LGFGHGQLGILNLNLNLKLGAFCNYIYRLSCICILHLRLRLRPHFWSLHACWSWSLEFRFFVIAIYNLFCNCNSKILMHSIIISYHYYQYSTINNVGATRVSIYSSRSRSLIAVFSFMFFFWICGHFHFLNRQNEACGACYDERIFSRLAS